MTAALFLAAWAVLSILAVSIIGAFIRFGMTGVRPVGHGTAFWRGWIATAAVIVLVCGWAGWWWR